MSDLSTRLKSFNENKLPDMVQLKYKAMMESPFRFFRGTCHLFYEDLSKIKGLPASPSVWACGDLHLENFGRYKANNGMVYFDLNDFDEAMLVPALWEILRLVTSIFVGFDTIGISKKEAREMTVLYLKTYAATLAAGKSISMEPRTAKGIVKWFLKNSAKSTYDIILEKRTEIKEGKMVLSLKHPGYFKVEKDLKEELKNHIAKWIKQMNGTVGSYKFRDVVFRIAGTGSIGGKRYLFLLKNTSVKSSYLLVDMKQSFPSSLQPYVKLSQPKWATEAERIILIEQRVQNMSSSMLSTTIFKKDSYVVKELQPLEDILQFNLIKDKPRDIHQLIQDMAVLTASGQLRSGGMNGSAIIDELKGFGEQETEWGKAVLDYAMEYAVKVKSDYNEFVLDYKKKVFEQLA